MRVEGKVAMVSGGGRGIGCAIALRLAQSGADCELRRPDSADMTGQSPPIDGGGVSR